MTGEVHKSFVLFIYHIINGNLTLSVRSLSAGEKLRIGSERITTQAYVAVNALEVLQRAVVCSTASI